MSTVEQTGFPDILLGFGWAMEDFSEQELILRNIENQEWSWNGQEMACQETCILKEDQSIENTQYRLTLVLNDQDYIQLDSQLQRYSIPQNAEELQHFFRHFGITNNVDIDLLLSAGQQWPHFYTELLPFIWKQALRNMEMPELLATPGEISLTQQQCLGILANGFLCNWSNRWRGNYHQAMLLPSINFDGLYESSRWSNPTKHKLLMILNYFQRMKERVEQDDPLQRVVRFIRRKSEMSPLDWLNSSTPLIPCVLHPLQESLDNAKRMFRVDFANRFLGGGALHFGNVQEEIMFCLCPELIAGRLFCTAMAFNESIVIIGAEQFSEVQGYGGGMSFAGDYQDPSSIGEDGILNSYICAIDAMDFRQASSTLQYTPAGVVRELTKTNAGFAVQEAPRELATGNWGCGIFRGDVQLKILLQWASASLAGKEMHYFPFDSTVISTRFPAVQSHLVERATTVGELISVLLKDLPQGKIFDYVLSRI